MPFPKRRGKTSLSFLFRKDLRADLGITPTTNIREEYFGDATGWTIILRGGTEAQENYSKPAQKYIRLLGTIPKREADLKNAYAGKYTGRNFRNVQLEYYKAKRELKSLDKIFERDGFIFLNRDE